MDLHSLLSVPCTPPAHLLPWLASQASMNEMLKQKTGDVKTEVLNTEWLRANWWARYALHLSVEPLYLREVVISSWGKPCWYARSYFPEPLFHTHASFFQALNHHSLGQLIFNQNVVQCLERDYYQIEEHHLEFYWPQKVGIMERGRWIRRAHYRFNDGGDFYLIELFFDDFVDSL